MSAGGFLQLSHGGNTGSNPVGDANNFNKLAGYLGFPVPLLSRLAFRRSGMACIQKHCF
jgi:hypothetical protein